MNPREALEAVQKGIYALASKDMKLEAYCQALEAAILEIGEKLDMPPDALRQRIREAYAAALQNALERAEAQDPRAAAHLDDRPDLPDLPNETPPP